MLAASNSKGVDLATLKAEDLKSYLGGMKRHMSLRG